MLPHNAGTPQQLFRIDEGLDNRNTATDILTP